MSEILEIDETQDDNLLFKAFAKQYGDLWLTTKDGQSELLNRFEERSLLVIDKHQEKKDEA